MTPPSEQAAMLPVSLIASDPIANSCITDILVLFDNMLHSVMLQIMLNVACANYYVLLICLPPPQHALCSCHQGNAMLHLPSYKCRFDDRGFDDHTMEANYKQIQVIHL